MFFNGPDNYQKLPLHVGDLDPHLIMVSWANLSHPQMASRDSFCTAHECDQQTHTGRDHATPSVTIDRIYSMHAMPPKNKESNLVVAYCVLAHPDHPCCRIKIKFCIKVDFRGCFVVLKCHPFRITFVVGLGPKLSSSFFLAVVAKQPMFYCLM